MFKSFLKATIGIALLPVDAVLDVVTIPQRAFDNKPSYLGRRYEDIVENLENVTAPEK